MKMWFFSLLGSCLRDLQELLQFLWSNEHKIVLPHTHFLLNNTYSTSWKCMCYKFKIKNNLSLKGALLIQFSPSPLMEAAAYTE